MQGRRISHVRIVWNGKTGTETQLWMKPYLFILCYCKESDTNERLNWTELQWLLGEQILVSKSGRPKQGTLKVLIYLPSKIVYTRNKGFQNCPGSHTSWQWWSPPVPCLINEEYLINTRRERPRILMFNYLPNDWKSNFICLRLFVKVPIFAGKERASESRDLMQMNSLRHLLIFTS